MGYLVSSHFPFAVVVVVLHCQVCNFNVDRNKIEATAGMLPAHLRHLKCIHQMQIHRCAGPQPIRVFTCNERRKAKSLELVQFAANAINKL